MDNFKKVFVFVCLLELSICMCNAQSINEGASVNGIEEQTETVFGAFETVVPFTSNTVKQGTDTNMAFDPSTNMKTVGLTGAGSFDQTNILMNGETGSKVNGKAVKIEQSLTVLETTAANSTDNNNTDKMALSIVSDIVNTAKAIAGGNGLNIEKQITTIKPEVNSNRTTVFPEITKRTLLGTTTSKLPATSHSSIESEYTNWNSNPEGNMRMDTSNISVDSLSLKNATDTERITSTVKLSNGSTENKEAVIVNSTQITNTDIESNTSNVTINQNTTSAMLSNSSVSETSLAKTSILIDGLDTILSENGITDILNTSHSLAFNTNGSRPELTFADKENTANQIMKNSSETTAITGNVETSGSIITELTNTAGIRKEAKTIVVKEKLSPIVNGTATIDVNNIPTIVNGIATVDVNKLPTIVNKTMSQVSVTVVNGSSTPAIVKDVASFVVKDNVSGEPVVTETKFTVNETSSPVSVNETTAPVYNETTPYPVTQLTATSSNANDTSTEAGVETRTTASLPVCQYVCQNTCTHGRKLDFRGCETCECKFSEECPPVYKVPRILCLAQGRTSSLSCSSDSDCMSSRVCCPASCGQMCRRVSRRRSKLLTILNTSRF